MVPNTNDRCYTMWKRCNDQLIRHSDLQKQHIARAEVVSTFCNFRSPTECDANKRPGTC
jgi:hypothetical protein